MRSLPEIHPVGLDRALSLSVQGVVLSKFDGDLKAAGEASFDLSELLSVIAATALADNGRRREAIACFLSASEGWEDAGRRLRGTFAALPKGSGLTESKEL